MNDYESLPWEDWETVWEETVDVFAYGVRLLRNPDGSPAIYCSYYRILGENRGQGHMTFDAPLLKAQIVDRLCRELDEDLQTVKRARDAVVRHFGWHP